MTRKTSKRFTTGLYDHKLRKVYASKDDVHFAANSKCQDSQSEWVFSAWMAWYWI